MALRTETPISETPVFYGTPYKVGIVEEVVARFKTATVRVAMGYEGSSRWEETVAKGLGKFQPAKREKAFRALRKIGNTDELRKKELGRFADLDLRSPNLLASTPGSSELEASLKGSKAQAQIVGEVPFTTTANGSTTEDSTSLIPLQPYTYTRARFMMDKVYCEKETGDGLSSNDEIDVGGTTVDEVGNVELIPAWRVSSNFDTGETKDYTPDREVHFFELQGEDGQPKPYLITLLMSEKDYGGFDELLADLYSLVKDEVEGYIRDEIGEPGGPIEESLIEFVILIVHQTIDWLIGLFDDDFIAKHTYHLTHVGGQAAFGGSTKSPTAIVNYYGGGGKYKVHTYWELRNPTTGPPAPTLVSPSNGAEDRPTSLTFKWNAPSSGITKYHLQVSTSSSFSTTHTNNDNITSTSKAVSGLSQGRKYYWRVRAYNGKWGNWSSVRHFTTFQQLFSVSISGDEVLEPGEPGTWTAVVRNAPPGSRSYQWETSINEGSTWVAGGTQSSYTTKMMGAESLWLKVTVTSGGQTVTSPVFEVSEGSDFRPPWA
jgi:hypothetical protein